MEKVKEPIKIWAKPLRNGNKALYLRRYIAGSHSKGYVYEKLDGLFLIDDKKGKDKIAKERNNQCLANCSSYQVRANQRVHERDGRYQKESSQGYGFERLDADVC